MIFYLNDDNGKIIRLAGLLFGDYKSEKKLEWRTERVITYKSRNQAEQ